MKVVIAAAVCAFAFSGAAFAQSACPVMPPAPAVPDGATAKASEMAAANKQFTTWSTAAKASLDCEKASVEASKSNPSVSAYLAAVAKIKEVQDSAEVKAYSDRVAAFNKVASDANVVSDAWTKAVEVYNSKGKK
jgi:hypothetical protein